MESKKSRNKRSCRILNIVLIAAWGSFMFLAGMTSSYTRLQEPTSIPVAVHRQFSVNPDCAALANDTTSPAGTFTSHPFEGIPVKLAVYSGGDSVSERFGRSGEYEGSTMRDILVSLKKRPNSVFVDIGANVGIFAFSMAGHGFPVYAIEPMPSNLKLLQQTWCGNDETVQNLFTIFPFGVSTEPTTCLVYSSSRNVGDGNLACYPYPPRIPKEEDIRGWIKTERLDVILEDLLKSHKRIVLKIDVEGYELHALRSVGELGNMIDALYAEYYPSLIVAKGGAKTEDEVADFFTSFGNKYGLTWDDSVRLDDNIVLRRED